jgi:MFS family permease
MTDAPPTALRETRVAVSTGFLLQGLVISSILTQAPRLIDKHDVGDGTFTTVLVLVAVVSGVGSVAAGRVAARRTSATALRLGLWGIALGAAVVGLASSVPTLMAAFAFYGLGLGAVDASMNMQGVRVQALFGRSLMNGLHGLWSVGGILGAGYASLCAALDVPVALSLLVVAVVAASVCELVQARFVPASEQEVDLVPDGGPHVPWRPVLVLGLVVLVFFASDTGILAWCTRYLEDALGASDQLAPLGYAAYQVGALVSRLTADLAVRRVGAQRVVVGGVATGLVGLGLVVASPQPAPAIAGLLLTGLGLAVLAPLSFAAVAGAVPPEASDVAIARLNLANYVGAILGGGLIGAVAEGWDLRWAFVVPLVLAPVVLATVREFAAADPERG